MGYRADRWEGRVTLGLCVRSGMPCAPARIDERRPCPARLLGVLSERPFIVGGDDRSSREAVA
jgi:hypothetical protein